MSLYFYILYIFMLCLLVVLLEVAFTPVYTIIGYVSPYYLPFFVFVPGPYINFFLRGEVIEDDVINMVGYSFRVKFPQRLLLRV